MSAPRLTREVSRAGVVFTLVTASPSAHAERRDVHPVPLPETVLKRSDPCRTVPTFGDAMYDWSRTYFEAVYLVTDVILPDVGYRYDTRSGSAFVLAWPWAFPFGPASARQIVRHRCEPDTVYEFVPYRLAVEAGVSIGDDATWWVRPGYSVVWHPKTSKFGITVGLGPTLSVHQGQGELFSSFELGVRRGACCRPGYTTLTARYERSVWESEGPPVEAVLVKLGLAYW